MMVRDRMSTPAVTISPATSFHTALRLVHERAVRHLPVVDSDGTLVGVVTERDLLQAAARYVRSEVEVEEIMTRQVLTTTPDTPIEDAALLMGTNKIGGLPVLSSDQQVVGMITETDIFQIFVELIHRGEAGLEPKR